MAYIRAQAFESIFLSRRTAAMSLDWLKMTVKLDGIDPAVRREIIVSPDISLAEVHTQILCPSIGLTPNLYCFQIVIAPTKIALNAM